MQGDYGRLLLATQQRNEELVENELLLLYPQDLERQVQWAAQFGFTRVLGEIILRSEPAQFRGPSLVLCHWAAIGGWVDTVQMLLSAGWSLSDRDAVKGQCPLHWAALGKSDQMVNFIVDAGADLEARDMSGRTALHVAAANLELPVISTLLGRGCKPGAKTKGGLTALHEAINSVNLLGDASCLQHLEKIVETIQSYGGDLGARTNSKLTAFDLANKWVRPALEKFYSTASS